VLQGANVEQLQGYDSTGKRNSINGAAGSDTSQVFYFSNFPENLGFVDLRKGLEVCGILDDVYVSRYRNNQGLRYGFAKFLKVKDVEKLRKALNSIQFWELRLFANIAKYELAETIGRLLKIDDATFNKDRMDYARFMIVTPSLSEINFTA
jgi:hypothetical protein